MHWHRSTQLDKAIAHHHDAAGATGTGKGARLDQVNSGSDDSDLVSTSESESDDESMENETEVKGEDGERGDMNMVSTSGSHFLTLHELKPLAPNKKCCDRFVHADIG